MHPQPIYFIKFYNSTESELMQVMSFDIILELRDYSHSIRTNKEMLTEIITPFNSYQGWFSAMNFHWYLMTSNYFVQMNFMRKIIFPKSISADCSPYVQVGFSITLLLAQVNGPSIVWIIHSIHKSKYCQFQSTTVADLRRRQT